MELYIAYAESSTYAGYGEYCCVWASNETEAQEIIEESRYFEDWYREQDEDQYFEEHQEECDSWSSIQWVQPVKGSRFEEDVKREDQKAFYPIINEPRYL